MNFTLFNLCFQLISDALSDHITIDGENWKEGSEDEKTSGMYNIKPLFIGGGGEERTSIDGFGRYFCSDDSDDPYFLTLADIVDSFSGCLDISL